MSENNIPEVTVSGLVQELGDLYTKAIQGGWPLTMLPTPLLLGLPAWENLTGQSSLKCILKSIRQKKWW